MEQRPKLLFCSILSFWLRLWTPLRLPNPFHILQADKTCVMITWPYPGTTENIYWVTMFRHSMNRVTPIIFCRWFLVPTASLKKTYLAKLPWGFHRGDVPLKLWSDTRNRLHCTSDVMLSIGCHVKLDPYCKDATDGKWLSSECVRVCSAELIMTYPIAIAVINFTWKLHCRGWFDTVYSAGVP